MLTTESENIQLTNQAAIVTGGGPGIRCEITLKVAKAGAKVVVVSRTCEQLDETAALIHQNSRQAISFMM